MTTSRDTHGRFKAPAHARRRSVGAAIAGAAIGTGALVIALFRHEIVARLFPVQDGHRAPDLAGDKAVTGAGRAPEAFRPDPTAPVSASEREALRPATGPATGFATDRGTMRSQTGGTNG